MPALNAVNSWAGTGLALILTLASCGRSGQEFAVPTQLSAQAKRIAEEYDRATARNSFRELSARLGKEPNVADVSERQEGSVVATAIVTKMKTMIPDKDWAPQQDPPFLVYRVRWADEITESPALRGLLFKKKLANGSSLEITLRE